MIIVLVDLAWQYQCKQTKCRNSGGSPVPSTPSAFFRFVLFTNMALLCELGPGSYPHIKVQDEAGVIRDSRE